ncbi:unnamed protein product [Calypogeia fissa]
MDHDQVIAKEKEARSAQGKNMGIGTSRATPIALQSKPKPRTLSAPRHMEVATMAIPLSNQWDWQQQ